MDELRQTPDISEARTLYPATESLAYFNTAAIGLASTAVAAACRTYIDDWTAHGLDYVRGEAAAESARRSVAALMGAGDHKYLLNAGRGMGYCFLSARAQDRFIPASAGWKAGAVPFDSFYGPSMELSTTASRFDQSISWLAAIGNEASLSVLTRFGADAIYQRNRDLTDALGHALADAGWRPLDLPEANRSTLVSVPLGHADPAALLADLKQRGVICAARDGNLRVAVDFYNHEADIAQLVQALGETSAGRP